MLSRFTRLVKMSSSKPIVKRPKPILVAVPTTEPPSVERTKRTAKANEDKDIDMLIHLINDSSSLKGGEMRRTFYDVDKSITAARRSDPSLTGKKVGGRGVHYDFQICVDSQWLNVEHKGSKTYSPIDPKLPPWTGGVQFYNGGMEKYRFAKRYAEAWYTKFIASGILKSRYNITAPIPTLDDWIKNDAKSQDKGKTEFTKELRAKITQMNKTLKEERDEFVNEFYETCSESDCETLKEDILPLVQESLSQKNVWLQVAGDIESGKFYHKWSKQLVVTKIESGKFYHKWSKQLVVTKIESVTIKKGKDILIEVVCDNNFTFGGILRWGYGAGLSNIRLDLR
jgi:hypothetical protein